jgi:hypothetical protein
MSGGWSTAPREIMFGMGLSPASLRAATVARSRGASEGTTTLKASRPAPKTRTAKAAPAVKAEAAPASGDLGEAPAAAGTRSEEGAAARTSPAHGDAARPKDAKRAPAAAGG